MIIYTTNKTICPAQSFNQTKHCLKYARRYANEMGWTVFPVPIGTRKSHKKAEFCDGRRWGATRNVDEIKADFTKWTDANIGIPTGRDNGIFVVDVDTADGHGVDGYASLAALEAQFGTLPDTLRAISPSGSVHYYFNYPPDMEVRNSTSAIGEGIDVRGEGGMVVAPPSVKPGKGVYRWKQIVPIADAPDWLLELMWKDEPTPLVDTDCKSIWSSNDITRVGEALEKIPAGCPYGIWFEILAALKNSFGDAACELARAWSLPSTKYSAKNFDSQWQSIRRYAYPYGLGTIYFYARQH
jgi:hypothetical protein